MSCIHDDVIKWKLFPRYWPFVRGIHRLPVNSPHRGQWRGVLIFSLMYARIHGWVNNREAGDLRRHLAHYDVIVMIIKNYQVQRVNLVLLVLRHEYYNMWLPWLYISQREQAISGNGMVLAICTMDWSLFSARKCRTTYMERCDGILFYISLSNSDITG